MSSQGFLYRLILSKVRSDSVLETSPFSRGSISRLQLCESILVWSILEYIWFTIIKYLSVIQLSSLLYLRWWEGLFCEVDFLFFYHEFRQTGKQGLTMQLTWNWNEYNITEFYKVKNRNICSKIVDWSFCIIYPSCSFSVFPLLSFFFLNQIARNIWWPRCAKNYKENYFISRKSLKIKSLNIYGY